MLGVFDNNTKQIYVPDFPSRPYHLGLLNIHDDQQPCSSGFGDDETRTMQPTDVSAPVLSFLSDDSVPNAGLYLKLTT